MDPKALSIIERCIQEDEGGWVFTDRPDDAGGPTYGGMTWRTFSNWMTDTNNEYAAASAKDFKYGAENNHPTLQADIIHCYHDEFWVKGHCAEVPEFAQQMYLSACVNMYLKEALKCLQMAVNEVFATWPFATNAKLEMLKVDGRWGPKTKAAANTGYVKHSQSTLKLAFSNAVMHRYIRIVQQNARAWREAADDNYSIVVAAVEDCNLMAPTKLPKVLQSENLMGWFNRAISYRSK